MTFRRALIILLFVLPFAVPTDISVSAQKGKSRRLEAPQAVPVSAVPAVSSLVADSFDPLASDELAEFLGFTEPPVVAESLATPAPAIAPVACVAPAAPSSQPTVSVKPPVQPVAKPSKPTASTASKHTKRVASKSKPKRAVEAIAENTAAPAPSLYDRRTAQTPDSGILNWFGPKADSVHYDSRMLHAAQIAETRARHHSIRSCWRYVKEALLEAKVVDTYPGTAYAKQAGDELIKKHGFRRLSISDPFKAPVGSVLVYGGRGAGHVEIRTKGGFVSDFESPTPSKRPLLGIFVKPS